MGTTVLIVDDHTAFRSRARRMLEADGFEVVGEASDGASGVDAARRLEPDVVLLLQGADETRAESFSPHAFQANLEVMIDRVFTARPRVRLLIGTLPPTKFGRHQDGRRAVNEMFRRTVRERAERGQAITLVDLFPLIDPQREMVDAHPNDAGYERIGEAFADALLALLGAEKIE